MNPLQQYRSYQMETVTPADQVALLYDGVRRFADQAVLALEAEDYPEVNTCVTRAQRILEELSGALNLEAGEVARGLAQLYGFWIRRLGEGLIRKEPSAFRDVSAAVAELRETWVEAARIARTQRGGRLLG